MSDWKLDPREVDRYIEQADDEYQPVRRDVTLRFYRHPKVLNFGHSLRCDEIVVERNGFTRVYNNPNNARYNRISKIVKENRIELEVDLYGYTEITFQADKE